MYLFETSWEVCNRVGGIYTVLSTKAKVMKEEYGDQVIFLGPDLGHNSDIFFKETKNKSNPLVQLLSLDPSAVEPSAYSHDFSRCAPSPYPLPKMRIGRWLVPGKPLAILIDYSHLWQYKDQIYGEMWQHFGVQSHAAMGDYDDSSLFGYAVGQVVEYLSANIGQGSHDRQSRARFSRSAEPCKVLTIGRAVQGSTCRDGMHTISKKDEDHRFLLQCHEWQTAFALFYTRLHCPQIASVFTTHATGIGRSIAGNGKPLYDYFTGYNGSQMAQELGMVSKHSAERQAAHYAHCFTTVSQLTARECEQLLDKKPDIVTENGFERDLIPQKRTFTNKRKIARYVLLRTAESITGLHYTDDTTLCCISGRAEWKNKGIDVFLDAIDQLNNDKPIVAFVMIPYLDMPHRIYANNKAVIFCPYYLNGTPQNDITYGNIDILQPNITDYTYYELLIGMDITIFPSYYEPWGYTPHESIAFHVPTICTDLSGFGLWAQQSVETLFKCVAKNPQSNQPQQTTLFDFIEETPAPAPSPSMSPVTVVHRTDSNRDEVISKIQECLTTFMHLSDAERERLRAEAAALADKATWEQFYDKYRQAYNIAIESKEKSQKSKELCF